MQGGGAGREGTGSAKQKVWHEAHPRPTLLSDFILGSQDGIVNVLGIILGLAAAGASQRLVIVAALAALGAESIAMAAVAYSSTLSRRRLYLGERQRELREMREVPDIERQEIREILAGWEYTGAALEELTDRICANPTAMLEFMMAFELKLAPVEETAPRTSAEIVGGATVLGHLIPLAPILLVGSDLLLGSSLAAGFSAVALFATGWYEARITNGVWWRNGLQLAAIGVIGGLAGFAIGHLLSLG